MWMACSLQTQMISPYTSGRYAPQCCPSALTEFSWRTRTFGRRCRWEREGG
jgi:hypothetical protein